VVFRFLNDFAGQRSVARGQHEVYKLVDDLSDHGVFPFLLPAEETKLAVEVA
jgi:hypothetical protein